jgi:hypothetical protein
MAGGGDTVYARGRVGGGRAVRAVPLDSAQTQDRLEQMATMMRALQARLESIDTLRRNQEEVAALRAKLARAIGDTVIIRQETTVKLMDGMVRRARGDSARDMSDEQVKRAGMEIGMNMDVLSRFIDLQSIDAVQMHGFTAGQMGPMPLMVYVVHQRP